MSNKVMIAVGGVTKSDKEWGDYLGLTTEEVRFFQPIEDLVYTKDKASEKLSLAGSTYKAEDLEREFDYTELPQEWLYCYAKLGILEPVCKVARGVPVEKYGPTKLFANNTGGMARVMWAFLVSDHKENWQYGNFVWQNSRKNRNAFIHRLLSVHSEGYKTLRRAGIAYWVDCGTLKATMCGKSYNSAKHLARDLGIKDYTKIQDAAENRELAYMITPDDDDDTWQRVVELNTTATMMNLLTVMRTH